MRNIREEELNLVAGGDIEDGNWCGTRYPGWWHTIVNPVTPIQIPVIIFHP